MLRHNVPLVDLKFLATMDVKIGEVNKEWLLKLSGPKGSSKSDFILVFTSLFK